MSAHYKYNRHRVVRRAANWTFVTKTRGVELFNAMSLLGAAAAFSNTKTRLINLPSLYNADTIDTFALCWLFVGLSVVQWYGLFQWDKAQSRMVSAVVLMVSSALWFWLATLTYHSAAWLTSVGVHRQLLYMHIILGVLCWLAADQIRAEVNQ